MFLRIYSTRYSQIGKDCTFTPMNNGTEILLEQFWGMQKLEALTVEQVEKKSAEYPYFIPLQLLLAQKYALEKLEDYPQQAQKTAAYFNNWFWLNELLANDALVTQVKPPIEKVQDSLQTGEPEVAVQYVEPISAPAVDTMDASFSADAITSLSEENEQVVSDANPGLNATSNEVVYQAEEAAGVVEDFEPMKELLVDDTDASISVDAATTIPLNESVVADAGPIAINDEDDAIEDTPALTVAEEEMLTAPSAEFNEILPDAETFLEPETAAINVEQSDKEKNKDLLDPALEDIPEDSIKMANRSEPTALPGIAEMKANFSLLKTAAAMPAGDASTDALIPIEPLYTVDYFASQGIKLRDLGLDPQDNLGLRLKSFTEWLKTMKRIHPEKLEGRLDEKSQHSIQSMAETSNSTGDILTEAMADVFAQQGLKEKAREVYLKLSLQNPAKSTYFAAKISNLNIQ